MSWNGNDNKDPWGRNDGPPDIDEAVKQLKAKVNSIFGGGSGKKGSGGFTKRNFFTSLAVIFLAWSGLGIYQVEQAERAVILRLGMFDEIKGPGLHWNPPIIDKWTISREGHCRFSCGVLIANLANLAASVVGSDISIPFSALIGTRHIKNMLCNIGQDEVG